MEGTLNAGDRIRGQAMSDVNPVQSWTNAALDEPEHL